MKKQTILNIIFCVTIGILLFYIRTSAEFTPEPRVFPQSQECRYTSIGGYAPSVSVTKANGRTYNAAFQGSVTGYNSISGGVITKAALDSLFCSGNYNALSYSFGIDPEGRIAPNNSIFVIIGAMNIQMDNKGAPVINSRSANMYLPNAWCPPNCMSFD